MWNSSFNKGWKCMLILYKMLINFLGIVMFRNLDVVIYFIYKIWYVYCMDVLIKLRIKN